VAGGDPKVAQISGMEIAHIKKVSDAGAKGIVVEALPDKQRLRY